MRARRVAAKPRVAPELQLALPPRVDLQYECVARSVKRASVCTTIVLCLSLRGFGVSVRKAGVLDPRRGEPWDRIFAYRASLQGFTLTRPRRGGVVWERDNNLHLRAVWAATEPWEYGPLSLKYPQTPM